MAIMAAATALSLAVAPVGSAPKASTGKVGPCCHAVVVEDVDINRLPTPAGVLLILMPLILATVGEVALPPRSPSSWMSPGVLLVALLAVGAAWLIHLPVVLS